MAEIKFLMIILCGTQVKIFKGVTEAVMIRMVVK